MSMTSAPIEIGIQGEHVRAVGIYTALVNATSSHTLVVASDMP